MLADPYRASTSTPLGRWAAALLVSCLVVPVLGQASRFPGSDRALVFAIVAGDSAEVARCLAAEPGVVARRLGAPPNPKGNGFDGRESALAIAVRNHRMDVARLLLDAGAAPHGVGEEGPKLLRSVALPEMLDLLAARGLDVVEASGNSASLGGELDDRPRHQAIARGLVRHGVKCDLEDAVRLGLGDHIEARLRTGRKRASLLYLALAADEPGLVQRLLAAGCALSGPPPKSPYSNWGYPDSVVQFAVFRGRSEDAALLLDAGAKVGRSDDGWDLEPGMRALDSREWEAEDGDLLDRAIDLGSDALVQRLVERGFDLATRGRGGAADPAVLAERARRAAWRGHVELVRRLVEVAATGRIELDRGPLELAAATAGHAELARALADHSEHPSPHAAAVRGAWDELATILDSDPGALERPDPRCGGTPLAWAVLMGRGDVVARLLARGARADVAIDARVSRARWEGNPGTTFPIAEGDHGTSTLIAVAIARGDVAVADVLLRAGARLDPHALGALVASDLPSATETLHEALEEGRIDRSTLDWASAALTVLAPRLGHADDAASARWQMLLDAAAGDTVNRSEWPSIDRLYALGASSETLRALQRLGAVVSEPTAIALGWAEDDATRAYVQRLEEREWEHALHTATRHPSPDAYRRLFEARADVSPAAALQQVHRLAYAGRLDLIEVAATRAAPGYDLVADPEVLENGADHAPLVAALLARGADPSGADPSDFGPLHYAARRAARESIDLLLHAGADPRARSFGGRTPLYEVTFALDRLSWGDSLELEERALGVIGELLAAGADPLSVDDVGRIVFEQLLWHAWSPDGERRLRALLAQGVDPSWL